MPYHLNKKAAITDERRNILNDDRSNASPPANIGICLLLSVFLVLCLFTFSAIALVQAGNEWHQAQMTRDIRSIYYMAASQAERDLAALNGSLSSAPKKKDRIQTKEYVLSDSQSLSVVFSYDPGQKAYVFSEFKTIATKTWEGDDSVNVIR